MPINERYETLEQSPAERAVRAIYARNLDHYSEALVQPGTRLNRITDGTYQGFIIDELNEAFQLYASPLGEPTRRRRFDRVVRHVETHGTIPTEPGEAFHHLPEEVSRELSQEGSSTTA